MALCQSSVLRVYHSVIEEVIANVRDAFLDDGGDEQVLQEMKQMWITKLMASTAVETNPDPPEQPPNIIANNPKPTKSQVAKAKKAAAAAAAASQQTNNSNGSAQNTTASTADVKPNIALLQQTTNGPGTTASSVASNNAAGNTANGTVKQEHQQASAQQAQSQPPPLHPTSSSSALLLQQQKQQQMAGNSASGTGSNQTQAPVAGGSGSSNQQQSSTIPIVAALDPNRIMPVNISLPAQPGTMNSESRVLTIHVPASALQENQLTQILTAHLISSIMSLPTTLASSVLQQHVNAALVNANMQKNFNTSKQMDGACDLIEVDEDKGYRITVDLNHINDSEASTSLKSKRGKRDIIVEILSSRNLPSKRKTLHLDKQIDGALDTSDEDESEESDGNMDDDDNDDLDKDDESDIDNDVGAEEDPLNSEDDVTDEDALDLFDTDNVIVCQYDKITRSRNKWKFYLKDGIMHINGKDYVFQKGNGDAEW